MVNMKCLAKIAVFTAAGLLVVLSAMWGSSEDSESSQAVTAPVVAILSGP